MKQAASHRKKIKRLIASSFIIFITGFIARYLILTVLQVNVFTDMFSYLPRLLWNNECVLASRTCEAEWLSHASDLAPQGILQMNVLASQR